MSRLFDDGANQYLKVDSALVTTEPFTLACWFYSDDDTNDQTLISIADKDATQPYHSLQIRGDDVDDPLRATTFDGTSAYAVSTSGYTANTWHHACGIWAAANDRRVYIDGAGKGTSAVNKATAGHNSCAIGVSADSTPTRYLSGRIAEAGIWNIALTDDEVAVLAKGYSPLFVRPQNLVAYYRLIQDEDQDCVGGYDMTPFNAPTIKPHPPVLYPAP